jgi:hypothetical protein
MRNHLAIYFLFMPGIASVVNPVSPVIRLIACGGFLAGDKYFRPRVAAGFSPLVVLLGQLLRVAAWS